MDSWQGVTRVCNVHYFAISLMMAEKEEAKHGELGSIDIETASTHQVRWFYVVSSRKRFVAFGALGTRWSSRLFLIQGLRTSVGFSILLTMSATFTVLQFCSRLRPACTVAVWCGLCGLVSLVRSSVRCKPAPSNSAFQAVVQTQFSNSAFDIYSCCFDNTQSCAGMQIFLVPVGRRPPAPTLFIRFPRSNVLDFKSKRQSTRCHRYKPTHMY